MKPPPRPTRDARTARDANSARAPRRTIPKEPPANTVRNKASSGASNKPSPRSKTRRAASGATSGPRASIRVYRQGLGDCILIRVKRSGREDFKLLIDCGVVLGTPDAPQIMTRVVENIVQGTGAKIDVLAITHEHWDHLSGFNQAAGSFKKLSVGEVWVAWTEDPHDDLAARLKTELGKAKKALALSADALKLAGDTSTPDMLSDIAAFGAAESTGTTRAFGAAADTSTTGAFDKAKAMAAPKTPRMWRPTDDPFEIPGANARIYALGPPHDPVLIRKINPSTKSPETYGLAMNGLGAMPFGVLSALALAEDPTNSQPFHERMTVPFAADGKLKSLRDRGPDGPGDRLAEFFEQHYFDGGDWRRIDGDWLGVASELALALQSYTNNTSFVLALELGDAGKGDVLLFAADAQVGNWESWQSWQWPKNAPTVTGPDLLRRTIFYKVGHHGSHNATLKDHGIEQMDSLKSAVIPVDEKEAKVKRWGNMPLPEIITALEQKAPGMVLRTDKPPANPPDHILVNDDYLEISL